MNINQLEIQPIYSEGMDSVIQLQIPKIQLSLEALFQDIFPGIPNPELKIENLSTSTGDYKTPSMIKYYNKYKNSKNIIKECNSAQEMCQLLVQAHSPIYDQLISQITILQNLPGFLFIKIQQDILLNTINNILCNGVQFPSLTLPSQVIVDFSSPNIAKQMHIGHIRSTVIGDSICKILEFQGHQVSRINHIGDWGTQFGMLICYLQDTQPDFQTKMPDIQDLSLFYSLAKAKFKENEEFKKRSQLEVVKLQSGKDDDSQIAWKQITQISRKACSKIYQRLNIELEQFGQSYYNSMIPEVLDLLDKQKLLTFDQGAQCIFLGAKYKKPLILVKNDGGYNYDTTDMAAIHHRIVNLHANRIIYVTDMGQSEHFNMIFEAAQKAGWYDPIKTIVQHVGFGLVTKESGEKFSSSQGNNIKLSELLDKGKQICLFDLKSREQELQKNNMTESEEEFKYTGPQIYKESFDSLTQNQEENKIIMPDKIENDLDSVAEKMSIAAIKYFELKQNRLSNYQFQFSQIFDSKANTAVYILYTYARLFSIIKKSGYSSSELETMKKKKMFTFTHEHEICLAFTLSKYSDIIKAVSDDLNFNYLTDYIYEIATKISEGYKKYRVICEEHKATRILLCIAIQSVLQHALNILGIEPLQQL